MTGRLARRAPGGPGIEPRWTHGAKVAQWGPHIRPPAERKTMEVRKSNRQVQTVRTGTLPFVKALILGPLSSRV
ncbi:MAG TPA: hypothetical protein VN843_29930 [Anaerolineales bacterium]|nr:hypothetical protein [Anaerolineales bacterium]